MESGSEIRSIIEDTKGGLCCEPGEYDKVEENIRWFIDNAGSEELKAMGARSRENLEKNLTRSLFVKLILEEYNDDRRYNYSIIFCDNCNSSESYTD